MRIGPIELSRARAGKTSSAPLATTSISGGRDRIRLARPSTAELGASGTTIYGGRLTQQDYNVELQAPQVYDVYDRMRKGDGQIRAALSVMKLPLLSVDWWVDAASEDPRDVEIAEYLNDKLMNMTITWHSMLRQAMLCLDYGSMIFEKVWELKDGLVCLRKLAPRMPRTVHEWQVDENGGLQGIIQTVLKNDRYDFIEIPVEKLLVFVNEQEGSDYKGTSILRSAYKHWYYKDKLYIIDAIAKERRAIGIDVGTLGEDGDAADQGYLESALMTLHAHEKQFFVEREGHWKYRVEGVQGTIEESMSSIEHHNLQIVRSVLAEFLEMGQGASGSLAMHKDKSSFFIMALESLAQMISDTFNRYLLPQWVDYNWVVDKYPTLCYSRLDTREVGVIADAIGTLIEKGALTPGRDVEDEVRAILGLPELPEDELEPIAPVSEVVYNRRRRRPPVHLPKATSSRQVYSKRVDFAKIEAVLDAAENSILNKVKEHQTKQITKLAEVAAKLTIRGDLGKLGEIFVPFQSQLAADVSKVLQETFEQGRQSTSTELGIQLALGTGVEEIKRFLALKAKAVVGTLADKLKTSVVWNALDQHRLGNVNSEEELAEVLRGKLTDLSDREIKRLAGNTVSEALNLGRDNVASSQSDLRAVYSSVLDRATCTECHQADGTEVLVGSLEYERLKPPYRDCYGRGRCRCVFVYIEPSERRR